MGNLRSLRRRIERAGVVTPLTPEEKSERAKVLSSRIWGKKVETTLNGYRRDRINRIAAELGVTGYSSGKKAQAIARVIATQENWDYEGLQRIFDVR